MRTVTIPFPDYHFRLDCNHLPEVRQWLEDNGVTWATNPLPTQLYPQARYSWVNVNHKELFGTSNNPEDPNYLNRSHYPLLTEQDLFQALSPEQICLQFIIKYSLLDHFKYIFSTPLLWDTALPIQYFLKLLPENLGTNWESLCEHFKLSDEEVDLDELKILVNQHQT